MHVLCDKSNSALAWVLLTKTLTPTSEVQLLSWSAPKHSIRCSFRLFPLHRLDLLRVNPALLAVPLKTNDCPRPQQFVRIEKLPAPC